MRTEFQNRVNRLVDEAVADYGPARRFTTVMVQRTVRARFEQIGSFADRDMSSVYTGSTERKWERDVATRLRSLLSSGLLLRVGRGVFRTLSTAGTGATAATMVAPVAAPAPVIQTAPADGSLLAALALIAVADSTALLVAAEASGVALKTLLNAEDAVRSAIAVAEAEGASVDALAAGAAAVTHASLF